MKLPDEVDICLRVLVGHFPNPPLSSEEATSWTLTLTACDFKTAVEVLDSIAASGRLWRPNDGEFLAAYRQVRAREPLAKPALDEPLSSPERRAAEFQKLRDMLR